MRGLIGTVKNYSYQMVGRQDRQVDRQAGRETDSNVCISH